jgi:uncharacterized glyoxalase superfamily protein PhnB
MVKPIPDGYHSVTPFITARGAIDVIDFLKRAFGAELSSDIVKHTDGTVMHAEVKIGDSRIMIAEESEMAKASPSTFYLYVADVDAAFQRAVTAGGKTIMEPMDMFYGDRSGGVKDPSGNSWFVATHIEDVSREEIRKRADEWNRKNKAA